MSFTSNIRKAIAFVRERLHKSAPDFYGVFSEFSDVEDQNPWTKRPWIDGNIAKLAAIDHRRFSEGKREVFHVSPSSLPALICNLARDSIRVLDFGGGTGYTYFSILPLLVQPKAVEWFVFDPNEALYEAGRLYSAERMVPVPFFCDSLPEGRFNIVHIASTLQYVEDAPRLLRTFASRFEPEYFILTRTVTGYLTTFVTKQMVGGSSTPYKIYNIRELRSALEQVGYEEVYAAPCGGFSPAQFYNVPDHLQIRCSVDLVFRRHSR